MFTGITIWILTHGCLEARSCSGCGCWKPGISPCFWCWTIWTEAVGGHWESGWINLRHRENQLVGGYLDPQLPVISSYFDQVMGYWAQWLEKSGYLGFQVTIPLPEKGVEFRLFDSLHGSG